MDGRYVEFVFIKSCLFIEYWLCLCLCEYGQIQSETSLIISKLRADKQGTDGWTERPAAPHRHKEIEFQGKWILLHNAEVRCEREKRMKRSKTRWAQNTSGANESESLVNQSQKLTGVTALLQGQIPSLSFCLPETDSAAAELASNSCYYLWGLQYSGAPPKIQKVWVHWM